MAAGDDEPKIEYSVRELLEAIQATTARIEGALAGKADRSDVLAVERKVDGHGTRIGALEAWKSAVEARRSWRMSQLTPYGIATLAITLIAVLVTSIVH